MLTNQHRVLNDGMAFVLEFGRSNVLNIGSITKFKRWCIKYSFIVSLAVPRTLQYFHANTPCMLLIRQYLTFRCPEASCSYRLEFTSQLILPSTNRSNAIFLSHSFCRVILQIHSCNNTVQWLAVTYLKLVLGSRSFRKQRIFRCQGAVK